MTREQSGTANPAFKHGLSQHPLFGRWYRMIRRCIVPGSPQYADYGGRGIIVCAEWLEPQAYISYVEQHLGPKPDGDYSIDRVDNNRGYEPGNLRWATRSEQNANQRQRFSNGYPKGRSGYRGVRLHSKSGLWQARVHRGGKERSLGYFKTPEEAAQARDVYLRTEGDTRADLSFPS